MNVDEVGRLLERLQQGVPGVLGDLVRLVEDVDLALQLARRIRQSLAELADGIDAAIARGVDLDEVERRPLPDRDARRAGVAGVAIAQVGAVEGLREDPGERRLARPARTHEEDGVCDTTCPDRVPERLDDRLLTDDLTEGLGTPAAVDGLMRDGCGHRRLRSRACEVRVPCTLRRPDRPRAHRDGRLGPGRAAALGEDRLVLLPSGSDTVRGSPLRGTRSSTSHRRAAFEDGDLGRGFSPAGADCRYRAPLVPRLARLRKSTRFGWMAGTGVSVSVGPVWTRGRVIVAKVVEAKAAPSTGRKKVRERLATRDGAPREGARMVDRSERQVVARRGRPPATDSAVFEVASGTNPRRGDAPAAPCTVDKTARAAGSWSAEAKAARSTSESWHDARRDGGSWQGRVRAPERAHPKVRERGAEARTPPGTIRSGSVWRRGRDSNPRCFRTPLFESGTINHSDTSPRGRIPNHGPDPWRRDRSCPAPQATGAAAKSASASSRRMPLTTLMRPPRPACWASWITVPAAPLRSLARA